MQKPFERTVRLHGETVLRVCRAALGAGADADDAWSETFLAALQAWPDLDDSTNLEAWLVRVATRKTIDVLRRRYRHPIPVARLAGPGHGAQSASHLAPGADTDAVPADVDALDTPNDIWAMVAALPERQRLAVAYHYFGGLPHTETADLMGGTPAAVRRACADGIAALRRQLRIERKDLHHERT